jgi:hypothetical protein
MSDWVGSTNSPTTSEELFHLLRVSFCFLLQVIKAHFIQKIPRNLFFVRHNDSLLLQLLQTFTRLSVAVRCYSEHLASCLIFTIILFIPFYRRLKPAITHLFSKLESEPRSDSRVGTHHHNCHQRTSNQRSRSAKYNRIPTGLALPLYLHQHFPSHSRWLTCWQEMWLPASPSLVSHSLQHREELTYTLSDSQTQNPREGLWLVQLGHKPISEPTTCDQEAKAV